MQDLVYLDLFGLSMSFWNWRLNECQIVCHFTHTLEIWSISRHLASQKQQENNMQSTSCFNLKKENIVPQESSSLETKVSSCGAELKHRNCFFILPKEFQLKGLSYLYTMSVTELSPSFSKSHCSSWFVLQKIHHLFLHSIFT